MKPLRVTINGTVFAFATTARDTNGQLLHESLGCLGALRNLRLTRASWVQEAIKAHGWQGPLISGVEQDHWPAEVKDRLRQNAREITQAADDAMRLWLRSGRRLHTFRNLLPLYHVEGSRY